MKLHIVKFREVMQIRFSTACAILIVLSAGLLMAPELKAQPEATNEWVNFYSDGGLTINGLSAPVGTVVQAYDPDGVLCGEFIVESPGDYGLMPVYRDDGTTDKDEGAEHGDTITFRINGETAIPEGPDDPEWTQNGDTFELNLSIEGPELRIPTEMVDFGTVEIGSSAASSISLSNIGVDQLSIDSIKVVYRFPSFLDTKLEKSELSEGESGELDLEFSPEFSTGTVEGFILFYTNAVNVVEFGIPFLAEIESDITPTNEWVSFYSDGNTFFGDEPVKEGDVIDAYDPNGVHSGTFTVEKEGSYGLMSIYKDDPRTDEDEGAEPGDKISFTINGEDAVATNGTSPEWTENGDVIELDLETNQLPVAANTIDDFEIDIIDPEETFNLTEYFSDPENDTLIFSATAGNDAVDVSADEHTLSVSGNQTGETTVEVVATDEFDRMVSFSFVVTVTDAPPGTPQDLNLVQEGNSLVVNWEGNSEEDIGGYRVYRNTSPGFSISNTTEVTDTVITSTSFTDEGVSDDNYYYYKITATDLAGQVSDGNQELGLYYISELNIAGSDGWSLISLPLSVEEENYLSIFPNAIENSLYIYSGGYRQDSLISENEGYWIKNSADFDIDLDGESIHSYTAELENGWNIIGALSDTVDNNSVFTDQNNNLVEGTFWSYTEGTLQVSDSFTPGHGYFVKASSAGPATFSLDFAQNQNKTRTTRKGAITDFDELKISADDIEKSIYINGILPGGWNSANFEVPPAPPSPSLDVRFANNLYVVEEDSSNIFIQAKDYPVTISLESENASVYIVSEYNDDQIKQTHQLSPEASVTIREPVEYLGISLKTVSESANIPEKFELSPNYPNPFNPTTQIQYSIAEAAEVRLEVFNILGRRVVTLINERKEPGNYEVTFDGSNLASGLYLYRLQAGDFISTKKFILAK